MYMSPKNDVNRHLSKRRSQGPSERSSGEFQSFQMADLDMKFLLSLLKSKSHPFQGVACIPDTALCLFQGISQVKSLYVEQRTRKHCPKARPGYRQNFEIRAGIVLTLSPPRLFVPPDLNQAIQRCRDRGARFAVLNMGIEYLESRRSHSNAVVIDFDENVLERFDSGGIQKNEPLIRDLFHQAFPEYQYSGPSLQKIQRRDTDSWDGMCSTFTAWYVLARLSHPHLSKREVESLMSTGAASQIRDKVLRLNAHIADTLRKHPRNSLR